MVRRSVAAERINTRLISLSDLSHRAGFRGDITGSHWARRLTSFRRPSLHRNGINRDSHVASPAGDPRPFLPTFFTARERLGCIRNEAEPLSLGLSFLLDNYNAFITHPVLPIYGAGIGVNPST